MEASDAAADVISEGAGAGADAGAGAGAGGVLDSSSSFDHDTQIHISRLHN